VNVEKSPKKLSAWWAVGAVLLLVGAAMWYETQYRALSKPLHFAPFKRAAHKTPGSQQPEQTPSKPDERGLLIG